LPTKDLLSENNVILLRDRLQERSFIEIIERENRQLSE
jgi:hypothetical protein